MLNMNPKKSPMLKIAAVLILVGAISPWAVVNSLGTGCPRHPGNFEAACSNVLDCSRNDCSGDGGWDNCPTCHGIRYLYGSTLSCTFINRSCEGLGGGISDCAEISYTVNWYQYDNYPGVTCPTACVPSVSASGTIPILDIATSPDENCADPQ